MISRTCFSKTEMSLINKVATDLMTPHWTRIRDLMLESAMKLKRENGGVLDFAGLSRIEVEIDRIDVRLTIPDDQPF